MKVRIGFVSNSSSSSFIISADDYDNVFELAKAMIPCREWDAEYKKADTVLIKKIKKAEKSGMNRNTPIAFSSVNYPTYIVRVEDKYFIATCNNHDWYDVLDTYGAHEIPNQLKQKGIKDIEDVSNIAYLFDFWHPECNIIGRSVNAYYKDFPNYDKNANPFCDKCHFDRIFSVKDNKIICPNCDKKKGEDK